MLPVIELMANKSRIKIMQPSQPAIIAPSKIQWKVFMGFEIRYKIINPTRDAQETCPASGNAFPVNTEYLAEYNQPGDHQKVRQSCRQSLFKDVGQKAPF